MRKSHFFIFLAQKAIQIISDWKKIEFNHSCGSGLLASGIHIPNLLTNYSRTHVIRILRGPRNLFELHDYSSYRSSDYMSSTVAMCTEYYSRTYLSNFRCIIII